MSAPKYSIVIPTFDHLDDLLRPCVESIEQYTDMEHVEVIVVANGCTDGTREYCEHMATTEPSNKWFKFFWIPEQAGYTRATNEGIKAATGEFVVLLNNDTVLLGQPKNQWLDMLEAPFLAKKDCGLSGPLQLHDDYADAPVLIFFCVMVRRSVFDEIGLLDEVFSPGGGEDIDFTIRARQADYDVVCCDSTTYNGSTNVGSFPIWHKNNQTFRHIPEYTNWIVKRNGHINCKRYNKNIRLNLGSGGIETPGFLSVDMNDKRAHIMMDCTKLDFDDGSVTEILASHLFEHFNPYHVQTILTEWNRVLRPGGRLVMEMPNIEELCRRFGAASKGERYGILNAVYGSVNTTNEGHPSDITSPHLFGWWPEALREFLEGTGFTNIVFGPEQIPHPESNLRVEATKPLPNLAELRGREPLLYNEIFERNVYDVEEREIRDKVVLDIGANVGYFTLYCIGLGAKRVVAVEAQRTIFWEGLLPSAAKYPDLVQLWNLAAHSLDGHTVRLENNHVGSRVEETGEPCVTVTLDTLTKWQPDATVLKLDCEGSEFDILCAADNEVIRRFETIYIEVHCGINPEPMYRDRSVVEGRLVSCGFRKVHETVAPNVTGVVTQKWARK